MTTADVAMARARECLKVALEALYEDDHATCTKAVQRARFWRDEATRIRRDECPPTQRTPYAPVEVG